MTPIQTEKYDVKGQVPSSESLSEEETATPTPRTSDSYNESSSETLRSNSNSEDDGPPELDEYYAFLKELAGSFAEDQDSESELSSEEGAGTEEEDDECEPASSPVRQDNESSSSPLVPPAPGQGGRGQGSSSSLGKAEQGKEPDSRWSGNKRSSASRSAEQVGWEQQPTPSAASGSRQLPSFIGKSNAAAPSQDENCKVRTPCRDHRSPVEDDYDIVQAVHDFAAGRSGSRLQQQREDLQTSIRQRLTQARNLLGVASSPHVGLCLRQHYSRVRDELLEEARDFEAKLDALGEEEASKEDEDREPVNRTREARTTMPAVPPLVQLPVGGCAMDVKAAPARLPRQRGLID